MRKILQTTMCFVTFGVFFIAVVSCPAQMIVGNYRTASVTEPAVISAANFAVEAQNKKQGTKSVKLISIEKAEQQVVAGLNYRLCLAVESNNSAEQATAIVYQNLQNKLQLTSWTKETCADSKKSDAKADEKETVTYKGKLEAGETDSLILYVGAESGDYAAFCFPNSSEAGRKILAACKDGEQCEFTGKVDFESACKPKNLEANLSASGKILSVASVKSFVKAGLTAKPNDSALTPDAVIRNLYAARKNDKTDPFFQTKSRALVDKYLVKDFGDLVWKDATDSQAGGGVGALDFDPLYNAQDVRITLFKVGKPEYGEGNSDLADVPVTFKNMGKAETILFRLERGGNAWKISDIFYPGNEDAASSLKKILSGAAGGGSQATSDIRKVDFLNYSYQSSVCAENAEVPKIVKVSGGEFKDGTKFYSVADKKVVYADLDGDGSEDAAVRIICGDAAGTLRNFEVHIFTFQDGKAKPLAQFTDRNIERDYKKFYPAGIIFPFEEGDLKFQNGNLVVESLADGSFAGPENLATFKYKLNGGKFVLSGKPTRVKKIYK